MTRPNVYSLGRDFNAVELDEIERLANEAVPGPRDDAFLIPARHALPDLCRQIRRLIAENADLREKAADAKRVAMNERANIVAWLVKQRDRAVDDKAWNAWDSAATEIESGEHDNG